VGSELACLVGGVPALHDPVELFGPLVCPVSREPCRLHHAAALRRWGLLVLAGDPRDEVPGGLLADPRDKPGDAADPLEGLQ